MKTSVTVSHKIDLFGQYNQKQKASSPQYLILLLFKHTVIFTPIIKIFHFV